MNTRFTLASIVMAGVLLTLTPTMASAKTDHSKPIEEPATSSREHTETKTPSFDLAGLQAAIKKYYNKWWVNVQNEKAQAEERARQNKKTEEQAKIARRNEQLRLDRLAQQRKSDELAKTARKNEQLRLEQLAKQRKSEELAKAARQNQPLLLQRFAQQYNYEALFKAARKNEQLRLEQLAKQRKSEELAKAARRNEQLRLERLAKQRKAEEQTRVARRNEQLRLEQLAKQRKDEEARIAALKDTQPKTPPPQVTGQARLAWNIPTRRENGESLPISEIDYYEVYMTAENTGISKTIKISNKNQTQFLVSPLTPDTYHFSMVTVDVYGVFSELSQVVSKTIKSTQQVASR